ncbi:MAG: hypothetical protein ABIT09_11235 [Croceibacterium sp.]
MTPRIAPLIGLLLVGCQRVDTPMQRIELARAKAGPEQPVSAPDTTNAAWTGSADGRAIVFALLGEKPLLTLECRLDRLRIIRHVFSRPGESALFPVLGGPNARFVLQAANVGGEARWQGDVPLGDTQLEVFHSGRLEATLPGGGSLLIAASPMPGEFIDRCRAESPKPAPAPAPSLPAPAR